MSQLNLLSEIILIYRLCRTRYTDALYSLRDNRILRTFRDEDWIGIFIMNIAAPQFNSMGAWTWLHRMIHISHSWGGIKVRREHLLCTIIIGSYDQTVQVTKTKRFSLLYG